MENGAGWLAVGLGWGELGRRCHAGSPPLDVPNGDTPQWTCPMALLLARTQDTLSALQHRACHRQAQRLDSRKRLQKIIALLYVREKPNGR